MSPAARHPCRTSAPRIARRRAIPTPVCPPVRVEGSLGWGARGDGDDSAGIGSELEQGGGGGRSPGGDVVPRLAAGLAAYGRGEWAAAIAALEPALAETVRIGGSRAQRDLIENTVLAAYLKAGRDAQARKLVAAHADPRPSGPVAALGSQVTSCPPSRDT